MKRRRLVPAALMNAIVGLTIAVAVFAISLALVASIAEGQVMLLPTRSSPGATEKYILRVANPQHIALARVELRIPRSVKILAVSEFPGWSVQLFSDSSARITAAVWSGTLEESRFVEFSLLAVNPDRDVQLFWPVTTTLANGAQTSWRNGSGAGKPAAVTLVIGHDKARSLQVAVVLLIAAVVLGLAALILALRSDRGSRGEFGAGG